MKSCTRYEMAGPSGTTATAWCSGNREGLLPAAHKGYYHEYTVHTPGASNRGARRIICGGPSKSPDACFYTSDHYQSFKRIRE